MNDVEKLTKTIIIINKLFVYMVVFIYSLYVFIHIRT